MNPRHTPADVERIEYYRIRNTVAVDGLLGLRGLDGHLDATAIAIEATMRDRAGLPGFIHELDAPIGLRNPDPWRYCPNVDSCPECTTALAAGIPGEWQHPSWVARLFNAIATRIDDLTARLLRKRY